MLVDLMLENQATQYINRKKRDNLMSKIKKKKLDNKKIINFSQTDQKKKKKDKSHKLPISQIRKRIGSQIPQTQNIK